MMQITNMSTEFHPTFYKHLASMLALKWDHGIMASIRAWEEEEDTHPPSPKKSDSS
jgi:hypothetical protein